MVAVPYTYTDEVDFRPALDRLPPQHIEAEEEILGGIMLDPEAIYRVKDRLKPEHFYIGAHKDIYQACLRLCKRNEPTDLLSVTSWLSDKGLLERIGGRNKLATLIDRTVSSVNIDFLTEKVIEKAKRRELLKTLNEAYYLAYDTEQEWSDIASIVGKKTQAVIESPLFQTENERQKWHYNQLLKELQEIYLRISDPGFKLYKLQELANRTPGRRVKDLEEIYMKSLCANVEARRSLDELEQEVGTTVRKWLLGGILPDATTMLVHADGGVGKTKWLYDLLFCLATGQNWNNFPATSEGRKVLIYQGDESKHDMLQALNKRGFNPGTEARQRTQVRFGWNTDAIATLYQDIEEFDPAVIMIDSLTFVNRYSIYDENRTEYSRPVLELNEIAARTGKTIIIVHHSSKEGKARGASAIKNAVSEVVKLERDTSPTANPQEKILTIEKSRSRRFPCSYRLFFNEEDFSFTLLEEVGQEMGSPDNSTKARIIKFLQEYANIKFEAEEIASQISTSDGNARRCCSQLARDGVISCQEITSTGTKKLYYISRDDGNCSIKSPLQPLQSLTVTSNQWITPETQQIHCQTSDSADSGDLYKNDGSPLITPMISLSDQLCKAPQSIANQENSEQLYKADHLSMPEIAKKTNLEIVPNRQKKDDQVISLLNNSQDNCTASTPNCKAGDHQADHQVITSSDDHLSKPESVVRNRKRNSKNIEVGGVYLSRSLKQQVKVTKIYKNKKADVLIKGDSASEPRLLWSDLYPLPAQPWNPIGGGQLADYGGEWVEIVGFASGGRKLQVEFASGRQEYVKKDKLKCPL
ncbi:putative replicative DNA helicase [Tolypothrix tenuis PCC 7101]|uniref:Putative replicative DNA helicase n=1 Tax=Tolypothrix tenuis PCC 7101 TaxID=231146 RepID=A0A1Z4N956_9CYAN|nr:AAA family ATPase [Aulosira sp. FACHB-113]BAZ02254.1 putative replicative DNA helicase [Tolypothrix tenuis PCC 7101]BAZ73825.1 putative replicative DNA helicase [Aulosira laxa NIES-50]